jgi:hypothetical protein
MSDFKRTVQHLQGLARPYLTALIATLFNAVLAIAYFQGNLSIGDYIQSVGPTNAMIIGFWFGERAALKVPSGKESIE